VDKSGHFIGRSIILAMLFLVSAAPTTNPFVPVSDTHLHNAHIVTPKVISGAQPDGEAAFAALQQLGVKTIISVDGAKPDIELAHTYGMRYVHIPIGYDGVRDDQGKAIAKAIDEMPGPIYVHCHHGKHRSAAAVAVACVMNGQLRPDQAESVLKTFGTGADYLGLWKAAREARPVDPQELKGLKGEYVEAARISDLAEAMVDVDHTWDNLKLSQPISFGLPPEHPDINPPHEALQLQEHFHEIARLPQVAARNEDFRTLLNRAGEASKALHLALSAKPIDMNAANAAYKNVAASCTSCHKAHRD
jgi:protein tyrosine phosphatase (PTP) superfamily phosphohydrolase (DUF442 family)